MKRLLGAWLLALGIAAPLEAGPITLVNHGFQDGLTGWITTGNVQSVESRSVETSNSDVTWNITPNGSQMGALTSNGQQANTLDAFFGLPAFTLQNLNLPGTHSDPNAGGSLTSGAGIYQDFTGFAGDTVTVYYDYVASDYIPYNDPAFAVLVSPNGFQADLISSIYGGGMEVGTAGNSGWRSLTFTLPEDGTHRIGFAVTNDRDTVLDSFLFLDDGPGTIDTDDLEPGEAPVFPVLPNSTPNPGQFLFFNPTPGLWYDPPFASAYTYSLSGGGEFTQFQTPDASFGFGDLTFTDNNNPANTFTAVAGQLYDLASSTTNFTLSGIPNGLVDYAAGNFATAFPVYLNWTGTASTLQIDVTAHEDTNQVPVPEPATFALLSFGLGSIAAARRRRAAQQTR